jgi:tripartite-type tricarboxylate transporter receptor subunit TctC
MRSSCPPSSLEIAARLGNVSCRRDDDRLERMPMGGNPQSVAAKGKIMRTRFHLALMALWALANMAGAGPAAAQSWPTRPITVVVPFAAGSSTDTAARILAVGMSEALGQQLVIENVGGAAGMTGSLRVARAPADGYQVLFGTVDTLAIAPALQKQPPYDSIKDFAPAGMVVEQPIVLIVREGLPIKTLAEFKTYAKANQAKMQFGSAGVGSGSHFACAKLNAALGIDTVHVPYRSSGLAAQDLIGGRLDYLCALGATARQPIESGKAKAVALLTADRSALFPQLTTSKEQGVAGVDSYFWSGFLFPKDTPAAIVQKLSDASNQTLNRPATVEQLRRAGIEPVAANRRSPAYQREFTVSEMKTWADQVKASGLPLQ